MSSLRLAQYSPVPHQNGPGFGVAEFFVAGLSLPHLRKSFPCCTAQYEGLSLIILANSICTSRERPQAAPMNLKYQRLYQDPCIFPSAWLYASLFLEIHDESEQSAIAKAQ